MCGIAGYCGMARPGMLAAMVERLRHRGPDDAGLREEAGVGLGMTRLAIIDIAGGGQPMANEDGALQIVFNGEIYNHRSLRADLEAHGHRFRTRSDTEAILHLYEDRGERCVESLHGMFAFAIWDAGRRRLFLARDRMGKKPLYYWQGGGLFLFASEIKAILAHGSVSRDIDWDALHHYLAFGYTPSGQSIFSGIRKLPPGHWATFSQGVLHTECYWRLPAGDLRTAPSPPDAAARIRHELQEAVRLRLESDVPLGVFLSGGVDSSAVVASMREVTSQRIATFSIGFGSSTPTFDELPYARKVAERFGTDHHEEILDPKVSDLLIPIVRQFDEPFADSSAVPSYVVAQAAARHVKVALSGIGGDEAFAGYPRFLGVRLSEQYARLPGWLRAAGNRLGPMLVRESDASRNVGDWVRRFAAGAEESMPGRYIGWTRLFRDPELERLVAPEVRSRWTTDVEAAQREVYERRGHDDAVDGAFRIDLATYLPGDLLTMADRMSMAHSLELRAPFCDHRLIETSLALSPRQKMPRLHLKGLLKTAFADALPPDVLSHRKQGFMIPLGRWLRTDLRETMEDLLSSERIRSRGLFDAEIVREMKESHLSGISMHSDRLWTLMMLELWMREYLDTPPTAGVQR